MGAASEELYHDRGLKGIKAGLGLLVSGVRDSDDEGKHLLLGRRGGLLLQVLLLAARAAAAADDNLQQGSGSGLIWTQIKECLDCLCRWDHDSRTGKLCEPVIQGGNAS